MEAVSSQGNSQIKINFRKSHFTALLPRRRKINPTIYKFNVPPQMKIVHTIIP